MIDFSPIELACRKRMDWGGQENFNPSISWNNFYRSLLKLLLVWLSFPKFSWQDRADEVQSPERREWKENGSFHRPPDERYAKFTSLFRKAAFNPHMYDRDFIITCLIYQWGKPQKVSRLHNMWCFDFTHPRSSYHIKNHRWFPKTPTSIFKKPGQMLPTILFKRGDQNGRASLARYSL